MEAVFLIIFAASNFKTLKMMKKMLIMMTSLMLALPIMAQYGRPSRMNSSRYGHYHQPPRQYRHTDVYYGLRIGGKIKDFGNRHAYSSFDDVGFKRFDGGVKVGCGLQYDYLYAEVGYDFGLSNISHDYFDTSHTGALSATIGVNF